MSTFDNNSSKKVTLKYITKHQCYTSKPVKLNDYLTSTSINNETIYDNFINTTFGLD